MRCIVLFQWDGEFSDLDDDDPELLTLELSRPCAESVLNLFKERGYETDASDPFDGEGGWHFDVNIDGASYALFTQWTGLGDPGVDYLAIQPHLKRGCLAALLVRRPTDYKLEPLCVVLDEILRSISTISRIQWLTDQEFLDSYCNGKPLPQSGA